MYYSCNRTLKIFFIACQRRDDGQSNLFFGFEAAFLACDDLGFAFGGLVGGSDRCARAQTAVGVERLDVAAQSTLGTRRIIAERTAMIEVQSHMSVELRLGITCAQSSPRY